MGVWSYPVKGCAGVAHTEARVGRAGVEHDRAFMVVGPDGVFRSQRRDPRLALIAPEVVGDKITLVADGFGGVVVGIDISSARRDVTMFGDPYRAIDQGDEAAAWLSDVLGAPSRLVRVPPEHDRVTDGETPGTSGFADSSPIHLFSTASYDDLCARIGNRDVRPDRFRPNLLIDGWPDPYTEDDLRGCVVGTVRLGYTKPAIRCAVTLVDQAAGARQGPEPLRTLAGYRRSPLGGVAFGTKFAVVEPGRIAIGDELRPTRWEESSGRV